MLCNPNVHYGLLSLMGWVGMLFAAESQLDHHSMPQSSAPTQHTLPRIESYSSRRPGASAWIESRGWVIRSFSSRKLVVSRYVSAVLDPYTRHSQLALSDGLIGCHGSLA